MFRWVYDYPPIYLYTSFKANFEFGPRVFFARTYFKLNLSRGYSKIRVFQP